MRGSLVLGILAVCGLLQGCGPLANVTRTIFIEPAQFNRRLDASIELGRDRHLANEAWDALRQDYPDAEFSVDYARGFKDGFADYLFAGGPGNPPPLPPRTYWRPEYETPDGQKAIADWFAGFRHGAAVARLSGCREVITIPSSVSLSRASGPQPLAAPTPVPQIEPTEPPAEEMPVPRPLPPGGGEE